LSMLFSQSGSLNITTGGAKSDGSSDFSKAKGRLFMVVNNKGFVTYLHKDQSTQDTNKILSREGVSVRVNEDGVPFVPSKVKERVEVGAVA